MGTHSESDLQYSERTVVNVIMPVYNGIKNYPEGMLAQNILNTLAQDNEHLEVNLIVIDNGSTDGTYKFLYGAFGSRINIIPLMHNVGMANAASIGLDVAYGEYSIIQSVRSWYHPDSLEIMANALNNDPYIGFVYGKTQYHGELNHLHSPGEYRKEDFYKSFKSLFGYMYRTNAYSRGCRYIPFIYRDGLWYDMADRDFQMQMIENLGWNGYCLDELVLHYYYGGEQMTKKMKKYQKDLDTIWKARWPNITGGFGGNEIS